jgi:hypothetical protein
MLILLIIHTESTLFRGSEALGGSSFTDPSRFRQALGQTLPGLPCVPDRPAIVFA